MINEYLSRNNQNLIQHLFYQAVGPTAYLNFCSGRMLKGRCDPGLGGPGLVPGLEGPGFVLGLKMSASTTSLSVQ